MRAVQAGPAIGLIAQVLLLAALAGTVGLGGAGWVVGVTCGLITNAALARGLARYRSDRLGPADWVTLARATLAVGVAALTADSFDQPAPVALLVTLTVVALALDAVDGWVARRTRTASALGARFDGEVDAFLILVLSVYVARSAGAWVLAIGAARYAFLAAGWVLPWMREPLPPRYWRKVVAATQGVVLAVAAATCCRRLDRPHSSSRSPCSPSRSAATCGGCGVTGRASRPPLTRPQAAAACEHGRRGAHGPRRCCSCGSPSSLRTSRVVSRPSAFVRLPLEGVVVVALALALPAGARRLLAWVVGPVLGLLVVVKILDIGFFTTFDRPFDPVGDWGYAGIGIETLRDSIGRTAANVAIVGAAVLCVAFFVLTTLAVLRLTRVAAAHRRWSLQAVAALGVVWVLCWAFGAQLVSGAPDRLRERSRPGGRRGTCGAGGARGQRDLRRRDHARPLPQHPWRPAADRPARQGRHPRVRRELRKGRGPGFVLLATGRCGSRQGTKRLQAAGFSSRSAFLTSSTFGGASWLAHSTLHSGLWVNSQRRYYQLVKTDRFTLSRAFKRAGWRTVDDVPSNNREWPQG